MKHGWMFPLPGMHQQFPHCLIAPPMRGAIKSLLKETFTLISYQISVRERRTELSLVTSSPRGLPGSLQEAEVG